MAPHSRKHSGLVARRDSSSHSSHNNGRQVNTCPNCLGILRPGCCSESIDYHWKVIPLRVKEFILNQGHLSKNGCIVIKRLLNFYSAPENVSITGRVDICGTTWYLALIHLRMGLLEEARSLTVNGSFMHQCIISPIERVKTLCRSKDTSTESLLNELSCCTEGFYATESPEKMESFLQRYLPPDHQKTMTTFSHLSSRKNVMGYVNQISNDFHSTKTHQKMSQASKGIKMELILMDNDAAEKKRHAFDILSSTTLKAVFTDYAEKRDVSLRSLRFSFASQILFLSQIGKKTPEELGMQDQDVIEVHDTSTPQASKETRSSRSSKKSKSKLKRHAQSSKEEKRKSQGDEGPTKQAQRIMIEMTQEELKIEHSKVLTKIHDELQPQLKQIRQRLNNLLIERSQPKIKSARHQSKSASLRAQSWVDNPCTQCLGIGRKAGKSYFMVQAGEVENLYKTRKSSSFTPRNIPTLDLHGYTRDEALVKLDESLKVWVKTAMQGSYPFVIQVNIICGCGTQILSEVVQEWIKSKRNVSNMPKKG